MINVTKTFLPPLEKYVSILQRAWDNNQITNNGELLQELENRLKSNLNVPYLRFCANGTLVLQMALKALNITKEVITTPFSYVATINAIMWEGCQPIFVDIDPNTFCIDPRKIESAITKNTQAILATHVYGQPCDVEKIQMIARKYNLKIIYDGAHAFDTKYQGRSLLSFGDISTCSFHATKIFQTAEGGAVICNDEDMYVKLGLLRSFGHLNDDHFMVGINAKNSELHAAMGLAVLPYVKSLIKARKERFAWYNEFLCSEILKPFVREKVDYNYSYYPIILPSSEMLLKICEALALKNIHARRYFYPSLNLLPQTVHMGQTCPVSESVCNRVLCLPMYHDLKKEEVKLIAATINKVAVFLNVQA
jgi:dTDP-4-amino-4,6-dideoxygalactose transaminase